MGIQWKRMVIPVGGEGLIRQMQEEIEAAKTMAAEANQRAQNAQAAAAEAMSAAAKNV